MAERYSKPPSLYDKEGRVADKDIAHEMAKVENPYHKRRFFGLLGPKQEIVEAGEVEAERLGQGLFEEQQYNRPEARMAREKMEAKQGEALKLAQEWLKILITELKANPQLNEYLALPHDKLPAGSGRGLRTDVEGLFRMENDYLSKGDVTIFVESSYHPALVVSINFNTPDKAFVIMEPRKNKERRSFSLDEKTKVAAALTNWVRNHQWLDPKNEPDWLGMATQQDGSTPGGKKVWN